MKTNYNNLTKFEACAVFVAVLGIALIGFEAYASLSSQTRTQVASAVEIFDLNESFDQAASMASATLATTNEFYNQFDIAFSEVFSFPDSIGAPMIKVADSFSTYADAVASNYNSSYIAQVQMQGEVLGASLVSEESQPIVQSRASSISVQPMKHYDYLSPSFVSKFDK